jgi:ABC-2 type transport system permease protein
VRALALTLRQVGYENRAFWRNPASAFFTFVFPLMFLVIFNLLFGNEELEVRGGTARYATFYVPGITALSIISACYTSLAMSLSIARDEGLLKRLRGTPLPAWTFFAGRIGQSVLVALMLVVIVAAFGFLFYDVDIPSNTLPAFIVAVVLGSAAFSSLGIAMSAFIPRADAAPAIVNASVLPLMFISDIFIASRNTPDWVTRFADFFPIRHLSLALQTAFNPFETGAGFEAVDLAVLAAWGVVGAVIGLRFFTWEPRR